MNKSYFHYFFLFLTVLAMKSIRSFDSIVSEAKTLPTMQEILLSYPALHEAVTDNPTYLKSFPVVLQTQKTAILKTFVSKNQFITMLKKATCFLENSHQITTKWNVGNFFYEKAIHFPHNAALHIIGDQHGSFHDTVAVLSSIFYSHTEDQSSPFESDSFRLKPEYKHHHWIFCGDLTDGGAYGVETLFVLLSVFLENPDNIHLVRGNHEDINVNKRYGFLDEIRLKFGSFFPIEITEILQKFYYSLPVALWGIFNNRHGLKNNYSVTLFCHGCIEQQDTDFIPFFKQAVQNGKSFKRVNGTFASISDLGYLWSDVNKNEHYTKTRTDPFSGRTQLSQHDIIEYMKTVGKDSEFRFDHIFRAHKHILSYHDLMPTFFTSDGICQFFHHKKPFLTTLLVMPCTFAGIPYQHDKAHLFPGVTQIVPAVLYQKEQELFCDFVHLPNTHIPDEIFTQHATIMNLVLPNKNVHFSQKHKDPILIKTVKISE
jgi:hypothetical protein